MSAFGSGSGAFGSQGSGFSFGQSSTAATSQPASSGLFSAGATSGFGLGQNAASSQPQSTGFSLGQNTAGSGGLFGSKTSAATPAQSQATGFGFGSQKSSFAFGTQTAATQPPTAGGFSFASRVTPSTTSNTVEQQKPPGGFAFGSSGFGGQTSSSGSSGFAFAQKPATDQQKTTAPTFSIGGNAPLFGGAKPLGATTSTTVTGFGGGYSFAKPLDKSAVATTTVADSGGFKLGGATTTAQQTQSSGVPFGFGTTATVSSVGGFSVPSATASSQPSGFTLSSTTLSAPKTTAATTVATTGFSFGLGTKTGSATASSTAATSTPIPATGGFSLGGKTSSASSGLSSLGSSTATSTAVSASTSLSSGFKLGSGGSLFGTSTTAASATASSGPTKSASSGSLGKSFAFGTTSTAAATSTTSSTATSSATSTAVTATTTTMKYSDLEAKVNSWMSELEQQEKLFLTQATHVNAWNKLLIENADKITNLNAEFDNVELSQKRLNAEMDYIKTQQNDLEELLKPLEEKTKQQMASLSSSVHTQHADIERERTYNLAENIDSQLKNMAQDLREVVEHINSTGMPADANNPVFQIGKILSAHMDSLQWLDSNSASLQHKVQDLTKQVDQMKREHESKFRLAFN